jgi:hypothetical protein
LTNVCDDCKIVLETLIFKYVDVSKFSNCRIVVKTDFKIRFYDAKFFKITILRDAIVNPILVKFVFGTKKTLLLDKVMRGKLFLSRHSIYIGVEHIT